MTIVWFGNLTVKQLKERHNLSITDEEIEELEKYRSDKVELQENTFHIYDAPEGIHLKGDLIRTKILDILGKYSDEFKYRVQVYEK